MKTFHIQIILFLVFTTSALLCSAPFDYLPQVQECSQTQITIPLTKGKFELHVSEHPEKSSPFIQALIHDKITANLAPADDHAPNINVLLAKTDDPLFQNITFSQTVVQKPESYVIRCFQDKEKNAYTICLAGHDNLGVFYEYELGYVFADTYLRGSEKFGPLFNLYKKGGRNGFFHIYRLCLYY